MTISFGGFRHTVARMALRTGVPPMFEVLERIKIGEAQREGRPVHPRGMLEGSAERAMVGEMAAAGSSPIPQSAAEVLQGSEVQSGAASAGLRFCECPGGTPRWERELEERRERPPQLPRWRRVVRPGADEKRQRRGGERFS